MDPENEMLGEQYGDGELEGERGGHVRRGPQRPMNRPRSVRPASRYASTRGLPGGGYSGYKGSSYKQAGYPPGGQPPYGQGGGWAGGGASGKWPYGGRRWNRRWPRWGWLSSGSGGSVSDGTWSSMSISQAQSCLAQMVGPWVPQNGRMGPATRRALRMFQKRQGLSPTGILDPATMRSIQSTCAAGPPVPAAPAPAPEPEPPPEDSGAAPDTPPEGAGAPPEAPPEGAPDTGVPDSATGELGFDPPRFHGEQEFIVSGPCTIHVQMHEPAPISNLSRLKQLPNTAGVYIIYSSGQPWYVGLATHAIRDRFLARHKALRDLNIPEQLLSERSVACVTLKDPAPACALLRKQAGPASPATPLKARSAALNIVEQFFIAQSRTNAANRGNSRGEPVRVSGTGPLTIVVHKSDGTSQTHPFSPKPGKGNAPGIVIDSRRT